MNDIVFEAITLFGNNNNNKSYKHIRCNDNTIQRTVETPHPFLNPIQSSDGGVVVSDTQSDSIQYLNFAKK